MHALLTHKDLKSHVDIYEIPNFPHMNTKKKSPVRTEEKHTLPLH